MEGNRMIKVEIARKLRETATEFGNDIVSKSTVCSTLKFDYDYGGVKQLQCPTISIVTLGNVPFKVARFFENI